MNDLVSIIMPSYNTAKFISLSIESVIAQTYENWELIIVDDCSCDKTDDIVAAFVGDDRRIRYLKNEKNSGAAVSRNRALKEAKGKWIAFLDSDDLWAASKLEKQIRFMENNGYRFSYTMYKEIDENSQSLNRVVYGPKKITKRKMFNYCWMGCLTVMYDAESVGLIQIEDLKKNNDYAMWLKICKKEDCFLLDEVLAQYRKRTGSISNHKKLSLVKHHYSLFRVGEKMCGFRAAIYTVKNLFYGLWKKIKYVRKEGV